jgi:hypothetical protein
VQNVTVQVIERHLVKDLPKTILHPIVVQTMGDDEVAYIAAEPKETTTLRNILEERKQTLEKGLESFKEAMRSMKR